MSLGAWFNRIFERRPSKPETAAASKPAPSAGETPKKGPLRFSQEFLALARAKGRRGTGGAQAQDVNPFEPAKRPAHPPAVVPPSPQMAMDDGLSDTLGWAAAAPIPAGAYGMREFFLGYPYLSELALRVEYRNIVETIATECTRRWIKLQATGDDADKTDKIKQLEAELVRLGVRDLFRKITEQDGYFGRSHLYVDTDDADRPQELLTSIGNGRDAATKAKIKKGSLKALRTIEAVWVYPLVYNSTNPLKKDWYKPSIWGAMGMELHESRLLTFIAREVPDMLKPAFSFGGQSMTQVARSYVDNWLKVRQGVTDIITAYSVFVLKTNMDEQLGLGGSVSMGQDAYGSALFNRADAFNLLRDNRGLMIIDKDTEDFANVSASLAGLEGLQAQAQEHMAAVSRIPIVKLLGIQPAGLNASSEGELTSFEATIGAFQERFYRPHLTTVIDFAMINLWGAVDEEITFVFEPLEPLNEKEIAEVDGIKAATDQIRIESGVVWPEEARKAVASDPQTPYPGLDIDDVPEAPMTATGKEFNQRKTVVETPEAQQEETREAA